MSRLGRDGTAEPVSGDQILRRERGQGNIHFPCSADHEQDWQPYRLIHTLAICVTIQLFIVEIAGRRSRVAAPPLPNGLPNTSIFLAQTPQPRQRGHNIPRHFQTTRRTRGGGKNRGAKVTTGRGGGYGKEKVSGVVQTGLRVDEGGWAWM